MADTETRVTINGHAIRLWRMRRGMSQRALSDKTDQLGDRADASNINKAENHGYGIGPAKLLVIAQALDVEIDELLLVQEMAA
jgi:transcriptional regulator with XRE-family HTH domain